MKVQLNNKLLIFAHLATQVIKQSPECRLPFCQFVPAFQKTIGQQCKVRAEYGCAKLMELIKKVPQTLKVPKTCFILLDYLFIYLFIYLFSQIVSSDDGTDVKYVELTKKPSVSVVPDAEAPPPAVAVTTTTGTTTPAKSKEEFGEEMRDLLSVCEKGQVSLDRFIGIYHQHFKRQLIVSHYGYSKLANLFKAIPEIVEASSKKK